MTTLKEIIEILNKSQNVAIMGHKSPDGDSFGSMFSLGTYLENIGKKVTYFCDSRDIKDYFQFIFPVKKLKYSVFKPSKFDLLIAVDCSTSDRLGIHEDSFLKHENTISIDHHIQQTQWTKYLYFDDQSASNSENIYKLLVEANANITPEIATYIYTGLSSDTNSFKNYNTNLNCYNVASNLYQLNADINKVNDYLYRYTTEAQIKAEKFILNNLVLDPKLKSAYIIFTLKDFEELNIKKSDVSVFSSKLISIASVKLGVIATEIKPNVFDLSMRCTQDLDVSVIATKNGGGGHKCAAGCNVEGTKEDLIKFLETTFQETLS